MNTAKVISTSFTGRAWLSLFLFLTLGRIPGHAADGFSVTPYIDCAYSSNIFWDTLAVSDVIISPGMELNLNTRLLHFFLNADGRIYNRNEYLNQATLSGGFDHFGSLSRRISYFLSPEFSMTRFDGDMSYLNASIPSLAVGLKHALSNQSFGRIGFSLRYSDYAEADSINHWRAMIFGEINAFFKSQTTLRLTLGMNYFYFPQSAGKVSAESSNARIFAELSELSTIAIRNQRGKPFESTPDASAPPAVNLSIPQPYIIFRIAQGLGYSTGLIGEIQYKKNRDLLPGFDPLTMDEWALQWMDEDFFWQGTRWSVALKTEAISKLEIAIELSYASKRYDGLDALDLEGDAIQPRAYREDKLSQISMNIVRSSGHFSLRLTASYRNNLSNDLYFNYNFYKISAGLEYEI